MAYTQITDTAVRVCVRILQPTRAMLSSFDADDGSWIADPTLDDRSLRSNSAWDTQPSPSSLSLSVARPHLVAAAASTRAHALHISQLGSGSDPDPTATSDPSDLLTQDEFSSLTALDDSIPSPRLLPAAGGRFAAAATPAEAASQRRTAYFRAQLKAQSDLRSMDKSITPLTAGEYASKQSRIHALQARIDSLRQSHALKKARVAQGVVAVAKGYEKFRAHNVQVAREGMELLRRIEDAHAKMQLETNQAKFQEEQQWTLTEREERGEVPMHASKVDLYPAPEIGPTPQSTLRPLHSAHFPLQQIAAAPGGLPKQAPPRPTPVLHDAPLPVRPAQLRELTQKAVEALESGRPMQPAEHSLLMSSLQHEKERQERKQQRSVRDAGELGVPAHASPEVQKQWVDEHVFQQHSPARAHAHTFPAPELPPNAAVGADSSSSTFLTLQAEKRKLAAYIASAAGAWSSKALESQAAKLGSIEAKMDEIARKSNQDRLRFEREKVVALSLLSKQQQLRNLQESERIESLQRLEYRRRIRNLFELVDRDALWSSDHGAQAMEMLEAMGRQLGPTAAAAEFSKLGFDPKAYLANHPAQAARAATQARLDAEVAAAQFGGLGGMRSGRPDVGWRDSLWEEKEWSHRSESSLDDDSVHSTPQGTARRTGAPNSGGSGGRGRGAGSSVIAADLSPRSMAAAELAVAQGRATPKQHAALARRIQRRRAQLEEAETLSVAQRARERERRADERRAMLEQEEREQSEWAEARKKRLQEEEEADAQTAALEAEHARLKSAAARRQIWQDAEQELQRQRQDPAVSAASTPVANQILGSSVRFGEKDLQQFRSPVSLALSAPISADDPTLARVHHGAKAIHHVDGAPSRHAEDAAGREVAASATLVAPSEPLFTVSRNRAALETAAATHSTPHRLGADLRHADPDSDRKHVSSRSHSPHSQKDADRAWKLEFGDDEGQQMGGAAGTAPTPAGAAAAAPFRAGQPTSAQPGAAGQLASASTASNAPKPIVSAPLPQPAAQPSYFSQPQPQPAYFSQSQPQPQLSSTAVAAPVQSTQARSQQPTTTGSQIEMQPTPALPSSRPTAVPAGVPSAKHHSAAPSLPESSVGGPQQLRSQQSQSGLQPLPASTAADRLSGPDYSHMQSQQYTPASGAASSQPRFSNARQSFVEFEEDPLSPSSNAGQQPISSPQSQPSAPVPSFAQARAQTQVSTLHHEQLRSRSPLADEPTSTTQVASLQPSSGAGPPALPSSRPAGVPASVAAIKSPSRMQPFVPFDSNSGGVAQPRTETAQIELQPSQSRGTQPTNNALPPLRPQAVSNDVAPSALQPSFTRIPSLPSSGVQSLAPAAQAQSQQPQSTTAAQTNQPALPQSRPSAVPVTRGKVAARGTIGIDSSSDAQSPSLPAVSPSSISRAGPSVPPIPSGGLPALHEVDPSSPSEQLSPYSRNEMDMQQSPGAQPGAMLSSSNVAQSSRSTAASAPVRAPLSVQLLSSPGDRSVSPPEHQGSVRHSEDHPLDHALRSSHGSVELTNLRSSAQMPPRSVSPEDEMLTHEPRSPLATQATPHSDSLLYSQKGASSSAQQPMVLAVRSAAGAPHQLAPAFLSSSALATSADFAAPYSQQPATREQTISQAQQQPDAVRAAQQPIHPDYQRSATATRAGDSTSSDAAAAVAARSTLASSSPPADSDSPRMGTGVGTSALGLSSISHVGSGGGGGCELSSRRPAAGPSVLVSADSDEFAELFASVNDYGVESGETTRRSGPEPLSDRTRHQQQASLQVPASAIAPHHAHGGSASARSSMDYDISAEDGDLDFHVGGFYDGDKRGAAAQAKK